MSTLSWTTIIVVAAAGGLGAALANRGIVLFNDAIRSVMPELMENHMSRREFSSVALGSSFGLIVGFGVPFSLVSPIILSHALWLGTDVIGTYFPGPFEGNKETSWKSNLGLFGSVTCGALFGCLLVFLLYGLNYLFIRLPVNFTPFLGNLSGPVIFTLAAIPALAITYQYGIKPGLIGFLITLAARQIVPVLGLAHPDAWAFLAGLLVLAFHVVRETRGEEPCEDLLMTSSKQMERVRGYLPWVAVLGAMYALSSNLALLMEGPQTLLALAQGDRIVAISYTIARAFSFLPLRTMSILATGVFTMEGLGFAPAAGLASPTPLIAAIVGAVVMSAEALSLIAVANLFNRFPCLLKAANSLRTAMTKLLEVASLVGGLIAANLMAPGFGFFAMAGLYTLNEAAGTPVMRVAVGPVFLVLIGLLLNLLVILHLR